MLSASMPFFPPSLAQQNPQDLCTSLALGGVSNPRPATTSRVAVTLGPSVFPFPSSSNAINSGGSRRRLGRLQQGGDKTSTVDATMSPPTYFNTRDLTQPTLPQAWIPPGSGSGCGDAMGSPPRAATATATSTGTGVDKGNGSSTTTGGRASRARRGAETNQGHHQTRAGRAAMRSRQARTVERLADATAAPPDPAGFERSEFLCEDGVTVIPYAVVGIGAPLQGGPIEEENRSGIDGGRGGNVEGRSVGQDTGTAGVLSFVAVHDFFDTLEKTFLLFKPLVLRHPGCQVLCFNSPGQAGTCLPPEPEGLLTNDWVADRLDELMQVPLVHVC